MFKRIFSVFQKEKISFSFVFIFVCLVFVSVLLGFVIAMYSTSLNVENTTAALTTLLMVAASSYLIGNVLGFLFGLPRTLQDRAENNQQEKDPAKKIAYQINTNLEQVSDWLTKMLIGVGLVEIKNLMEFVVKISSKISSDIGHPNAESIIVASIICFTILGFFVTYFSTRLYISSALASADVGLQEISTEENASGEGNP